MAHDLSLVALLAGALFLCVPLSGCDQSDAGRSGASTDSRRASGETLSKSDELFIALHGPTATQMAGNANKWKGRYVHFPCKITNVVDGPAANAMCGKGVTATFEMATPNVDYSDPNAVDRAMKQAEASENRQMALADDEAMIVLVGDKVSGFDGGQVVTITGQVLGTQQGQNAMGATIEYPTVRVDFAK